MISKYLLAFLLICTPFAVDACWIDGEEYPAVGYGTYPLKGELCTQSITKAAAIGYRMIDTATFYENLGAIGDALQVLGRKNFYVTSKVWHDSQTPKLLKRDLMRTLKKLKTSYLDAYLLHWPNSKISIEDTLCAMEELRIKGKIRHIGLSNVTVNHLKRALEVGVPITWIQVEMHVSFYQPELLEFCKEHGIAVQAWAPLDRGRVASNPVVREIADKYGKTPTQVALKWVVQHGCVPLPASKNEAHMQQNFAISDFTLSQEEMEEINAKAKQGQRDRVTPETGFGFTDEFDFTYDECWPKRS